MSIYTWFGETKQQISNNTETSENPIDNKLNNIIQRMEILENENQKLNEKVIYFENELNKNSKNESVVDTSVSTSVVDDEIVVSVVDMPAPTFVINDNYDNDDDDDGELISVVKIIIGKKNYYCDQYGVIYDFTSHYIIGKYEVKFNSLIPIFK
jgi:hypothetical protein